MAEATIVRVWSDAAFHHMTVRDTDSVEYTGSVANEMVKDLEVDKQKALLLEAVRSVKERVNGVTVAGEELKSIKGKVDL